jgi:AcrR family transcriptional regulator
MRRAMIAMTIEHGYASPSVKRVVEVAAVSRRAFYEQFKSKEDCFLSTVDWIFSEALAASTHAQDLEAGLAGLARGLQEHRDRAVTVLVIAPTIGPAGWEAIEKGSAPFEWRLRAALRAGRGGVDVGPIAAKAIIGGVRRVSASALRADTGELVDGLLDWVLSYQRPPAPAGQAQTRAEQEDPGGRSLTDPERPARERVLDAMELLVATAGYAEMSVSEIAATTDLDLDDVLDLFPTLADCFLAWMERTAAEILEAGRDAGRHAGSWPEAVERRVCTVFTVFATRPGMTRLMFRDSLLVDARAIDRVTAFAAELTTMLLGNAPQPAGSKGLIEDAIAGGLHEILYSGAKDPRVLPHLAELATQITCAPFICGARRLAATGS